MNKFVFTLKRPIVMAHLSPDIWVYETKVLLTSSHNDNTEVIAFVDLEDELPRGLHHFRECKNAQGILTPVRVTLNPDNILSRVFITGASQ